MLRSGKYTAVLLLALFLALGPVLAADREARAEVSQEDMIKVYNQARKAIMDEDTVAFEKVVMPAKPDVPKMTKKDLAEAKGFIEAILPDLSKAKIHKFDQNAGAALLVVETDLDDKENISLNAFRFRNKDGVWMLWAKFKGSTFSSQGAAEDKKQIEKIIAENSDFKLLSQEEQAARKESAAQAAAAPSGKTGSGSLTVAGTVYNFGHAFAFRKKALGYDDKINVHVILTEKAVSVEEIKAQLREKDDWSAFVNNLVLVFDPEMKAEYVSFWVRKDSTNFSGPPSHTKGSAKVEGDRIKGSLKMEQPKKLFGDSFIYDVSFDAPIISK